MTLLLGPVVLYVTLLIWIHNTGHLHGDKLFVAEAGNGTIYVAESNGFSFVNATFKALPLSHVSDPIGIDYDPRNDMIYWTDESLHTVNRARLDGSFQEVVVQVSAYYGFPQGVVLDLAENKVYWTDPYFRVIEVANLDGTQRRPIVNARLEIPRGITLSNKRRKLFWTDRGSEPKIEMSDMDGSHRTVLVTDNLVHPNGIALDFNEQRLYWTDTDRNSIESMDLDDFSNRFVHLEFGFDSHPFGVTLYYEDIYFSEIGSHRLYGIDFPDGDIIDLGFVLPTPTEIHIYADRSCPSADFCPGQSTCSVLRRQPMLVVECMCLLGYGDPRCSDINECLGTGVDYPCDVINGDCLNTDGSYECTCDTGYELVRGGPNCTDTDECQAIPSPCSSSNEICRNEDGGYNCECETGYERQYGNCLDVNECRLGSPCGANEDCFNTEGNYTCSCSLGFEMKNDACLALNSVQGSLRITHLNGVPITFTDGLRDPSSDEFHNMERNCLKVIRNQALDAIDLEVFDFEVIQFLEGSIIADFIIKIFNSNQALSRQQAEMVLDTLQSTDPGVWSSIVSEVSLTVSSITVNVIGDACRSSPCQYGTCRSIENDFMCDCMPGYKGLLCDTVVTCSLPADPVFSHIENPRGTYNGGDMITITCDDDSDSVSWTCDVITGVWSQEPIDCGRTQDFPVMIVIIIGAVAAFVIIIVISGIVLCVRVKRRRPTTDEQTTEMSSLPPCNYYETSLPGVTGGKEMNHEMLNRGFDPIYESLPGPVGPLPAIPRAMSANGHTPSVSSAVGAGAAGGVSDRGACRFERPPSYSVQDPIASGGKMNLYERAILPSRPREDSIDFTATTVDNGYLEVLA